MPIAVGLSRFTPLICLQDFFRQNLAIVTFGTLIGKTVGYYLVNMVIYIEFPGKLDDETFDRNNHHVFMIMFGAVGQ